MSQPKITGQFVGGFLESTGDVSSVFEQKARNILESNGIEEVDPEGWYPIDQFADAMNQIEEEVGEKTSEKAGVTMIEIIDELSNIGSMEETIEIAKEQQRQSYQNFSPEEAGQLKYGRLDNGNGRVAYYGGWPYPEAFTRGIVKGFAEATSGLGTTDIKPMEAQGDEVYAFEVIE